MILALGFGFFNFNRRTARGQGFDYPSSPARKIDLKSGKTGASPSSTTSFFFVCLFWTRRHQQHQQHYRHRESSLSPSRIIGPPSERPRHCGIVRARPSSVVHSSSPGPPPSLPPSLSLASWPRLATVQDRCRDPSTTGEGW